MPELRHLPNARYNFYWLMAHVAFSKGAFAFFEGRRRAVADSFMSNVEASQCDSLMPVPQFGASPHKIDPTKPAIFPGAARDFPCQGKWTPAFFARHYGNAVVPFVDHSKDRSGEIEYASMREVIERLDNATLKYAKFSGLMHEHPELAKDFRWDVHKNILPQGTFLSSMQLFIGGAGTRTLTHCALSLNIFVQIHGTKRWVIYPPWITPAIHPPMDRAPFFRSGEVFEEPDPATNQRYRRYPGYECVLEPGDILYNPPYYWHYVTNPSASIGVSFKYQNPWVSVRTAPAMFMMSMLATNPNVVSGFLAARRGRNLPVFQDASYGSRNGDPARSI